MRLGLALGGWLLSAALAVLLIALAAFPPARALLPPAAPPPGLDDPAVILDAARLAREKVPAVRQPFTLRGVRLVVVNAEVTGPAGPPAAEVRATALAGVRAGGADAAEYVEGGPGDAALVVWVETVDAGAAGVVCRVQVTARRPALLTAPGWAGQTAAGVWDRSRVGLAPVALAPAALLGIVRELTAAFATDWRAANPG